VDASPGQVPGRKAGAGRPRFRAAAAGEGGAKLVLSLRPVDDRATSLLLARFYQNQPGKRQGLAGPMPQAEALGEAKCRLRGRGQKVSEIVLAAFLNKRFPTLFLCPGR
jgi:CHAT domain-containing protein